MALFNTPPRTALRDGSGPRAVDGSSGSSNKHRSSGRRPSKGDDSSDKHRPKRRDSHSSKSTKRDGHRRKASASSVQQPGPSRIEQPTLELTVVGQPARGIPLGAPVNASVVLSLRNPASSPSNAPPDRIDTSRLFGVTTLVADGVERTPLEAGALGGPKTYDSVHEMGAESARMFERIHRERVVLGYFSFPGLVIRQAGTFRVRTTLARTGAEGAVSLVAVDSEPVKVERRVAASGQQVRRGQRVYG